jgi:hypothetical protein
MPLDILCTRKRFTEAEVGAVSEIFSALCASNLAKVKKAHTRTLLSFVRNILAVRGDPIRKDATLAGFSKVYSITDDEVYYEAVVCSFSADSERMAPNPSSIPSSILLPSDNS